MNDTRLSSYEFLWLSLTILVLVTLSFLVAIQPQDYWWCLRIGQDTLLTGAVPVTETLSWSQAGQSIMYEPWLACVVLNMTNNLGGVSAIFLLRGVLLGLTYGLIWFMVKQSTGPQLATVLVLLMGLASSNNWQVRAQLFAYPLFVLCTFILYTWQRGNNKLLWVLPVVMILWANLHGSFILGLVLAGSAFVFGRGSRRSLLIVLALMIAGTLITPHGIALWKHLQFMLTVPSNQEYSLEWRPPTNTGWQMNFFFVWVLLFVPLTAYSSRKISFLEWIWFLGFGWLAFSGTRYVIWFLFLLVLLTAVLLAGVMSHGKKPLAKPRFPAINIVLGCFLVLSSLFYLPGIREKWWMESPPAYSSDNTPIDAVDWLKEHPELPGPLWNDYAFGSYLSFALPSRPVWLDSRFFPFSSEQMDDYVEISHGSNIWEAWFQNKGINLLVLSTKTQPKLIELVEASNAWCEQYNDEVAVIFSRCEPIQ